MLQALARRKETSWYGQQIERSRGSSGTGYWKATSSHEKRKEKAFRYQEYEILLLPYFHSEQR